MRSTFELLIRLGYKNTLIFHYLVGGGYSYGVAHSTPGNLGAALLAGTYYLTRCVHICMIFLNTYYI